MKLFTGWCWRPDWSLLRAARQAQVPAPYDGRVAPYDGVRCRRRRYARGSPPAAVCRRGLRGRLRPEPAAVDGSLRRAARQRIFAARHPAAARLRLHDRGDRPRRRGRPAGDRRAQRPDPPLRAGLPGWAAMSTTQLTVTLWSAARCRRPGVGRAAAAKPRAAGRQPPRSDAEAEPARAAESPPAPPRAGAEATPPAAPAPPQPVQQPAAAPAETGCRPDAARAAVTTGSRSQAKPAPHDRADPGDAEGARAGVADWHSRVARRSVATLTRRQTSITIKTPRFPGAFSRSANIC